MTRVIFACQATSGAAPGTYTASNHWITGFICRGSLSGTASGSRRFLHDVLQTAKPDIDLNRTILMNETAVYFEDARNQTVDIAGSRHVVDCLYPDYCRTSGVGSRQKAATSSDLEWQNALPRLTKVGGVYVAYQSRARQLTVEALN
ncbi:Hypothetical protein PHPALM_17318 [Phytophthora palmivora]|uniref:Uncharacterized protein n=1 Tax=Phytophthora palmivora TaxID=4796 RepID=A0A2P4XMH2_9STRA|nr:Hypothetical protein PHPALM_17318 [Phytophthora palmivora]